MFLEPTCAKNPKQPAPQKIYLLNSLFLITKFRNHAILNGETIIKLLDIAIGVSCYYGCHTADSAPIFSHMQKTGFILTKLILLFVIKQLISI